MFWHSSVARKCYPCVSSCPARFIKLMLLLLLLLLFHLLLLLLLTLWHCREQNQTA